MYMDISINKSIRNTELIAIHLQLASERSEKRNNGKSLGFFDPLHISITRLFACFCLIESVIYSSLGNKSIGDWIRTIVISKLESSTRPKRACHSSDASVNQTRVDRYKCIDCYFHVNTKGKFLNQKDLRIWILITIYKIVVPFFRCSLLLNFLLVSQCTI